MPLLLTLYHLELFQPMSLPTDNYIFILSKSVAPGLMQSSMAPPRYFQDSSSERSFEFMATPSLPSFGSKSGRKGGQTNNVWY
jgi:hypothetical protein